MTKFHVDEEMRAFVSRLHDDTSRLVFADYLDEKYPATPVKVDLPPWFQRWWCTSGNNQKWTPPAERRGVSRYNIDHALSRRVLKNDTGVKDGIDWVDHDGQTVVGGIPVYVSEPYMGERMALLTAKLLQQRLGCPVSYSREAAHFDSPAIVRITVWFSVEIVKPDFSGRERKTREAAVQQVRQRLRGRREGPGAPAGPAR